MSEIAQLSIEIGIVKELRDMNLITDDVMNLAIENLKRNMEIKEDN